MDTTVQNLKASIKRSPALHRLYLNFATLGRYLSYRLYINDDCRLKDKWDFSTPSEQGRHRNAISVVRAMIRPDFGDVLEVGCERGTFTARLAPLATSVTAIDVSEESCREAQRRCSDFSHVKIRRVNLLKENISGQFDVVFVMCVLCYFKGSARFRETANKLHESLREGGLLVIQEMRLIPEVEDSSWVRWLNEGAFQICDFFERQTPFQLVQKDIKPDHVTAVYRKPLLVDDAPSADRSLRSRAKTLLRQLRIFRQLSKSAQPIPFSQRISAARKLVLSSSKSLLRPPALEQLQRHCESLDAHRIEGDIVECGVYRGGSALLLGDAATRSPMNRHLWLFDSFQGLPVASAKDGPSAPYLENTLKSDPQEVAGLLLKHGIPADKTSIIPGWFSDTLHKAPIQRIALLHIDGDWYSSVKQCLNGLYHLVSPGGIIVLDDYNDWPGCKIALDEFIRENGLQVGLEGGSDGPRYFRKRG